MMIIIYVLWGVTLNRWVRGFGLFERSLRAKYLKKKARIFSVTYIHITLHR